MLERSLTCLLLGNPGTKRAVFCSSLGHPGTKKPLPVPRQVIQVQMRCYLYLVSKTIKD